MIKILHSIGHLLRGGIETWLFQMVRRLDPDQFEQHVMVRTNEEESFTGQFREAGARVIPCLNYKNPVRYAFNFAKLVNENGPYDVLHVHGGNGNGLQSSLLAKRLGIKRVVIHSHNDLRPLLHEKNKLYRVYNSFAMGALRHAADRGLAASNLAAESMFGLDWNKDPKFQLLFYGIDFAPFAQPPVVGLRNSLGIPADAFLIGHTGRFHEQKNHAFIVEIARATVRKNPKAHFLFIGDGELRPGIAADFNSPDLLGHATFVPDTTSVAPYMAIMDCFLFPSRYEGLGLVAVEAQAAGLPCFISDRVPGEAIVDPQLVTVLKLEDAPAIWAEAVLQSVNSHPAANLNLMQNSRFNLDRNAATLATIYQTIVGQTSRSASLTS